MKNKNLKIIGLTTAVTFIFGSISITTKKTHTSASSFKRNTAATSSTGSTNPLLSRNFGTKSKRTIPVTSQNQPQPTQPITTLPSTSTDSNYTLNLQLEASRSRYGIKQRNHNQSKPQELKDMTSFKRIASTSTTHEPGNLTENTDQITTTNIDTTPPNNNESEQNTRSTSNNDTNDIPQNNNQARLTFLRGHMSKIFTRTNRQDPNQPNPSEEQAHLNQTAEEATVETQNQSRPASIRTRMTRIFTRTNRQDPNQPDSPEVHIPLRDLSQESHEQHPESSEPLPQNQGMSPTMKKALIGAGISAAGVTILGIGLGIGLGTADKEPSDDEFVKSNDFNFKILNIDNNSKNITETDERFTNTVKVLKHKEEKDLYRIKFSINEPKYKKYYPDGVDTHTMTLNEKSKPSKSKIKFDGKNGDNYNFHFDIRIENPDKTLILYILNAKGHKIINLTH